MSLLISSVLVAGGVLLGRWIAKGEWAQTSVDAEGESNGAAAPKDEARESVARREREEPKGSEPPIAPKKRAEAPRDPFADMPCKLGDVILRAGGGEAWLAGASVFREDHPVSVLFVAPDAVSDRAIYVRARPTPQLSWLLPIASGEITLGAEPPTSLEHAGVRYERARRLPVNVERFGSGAPDVGEQVIVAEYASTGFERLLVVTGGGSARAWVGSLMEDGTYEVLPSGKSTLEG